MKLCFAILLGLGLVATSPAFAAGTNPCDAFPWPLDGEKILLARAAGTTVSAGSYLNQDPPVGFQFLLTPTADVPFAHPPRNTPAAKGYSGVLSLGTPPADGDYLVTLSSDGSVDIIQGRGTAVRVDAAVVKDCPTIRESIKFRLNGRAPITLQISGASQSRLNVAVTPANYLYYGPNGLP